MPKVYPATAAKKAQEASGDAALLATTWKDKIKAADAGECHLTSIDSAKIEALSASEKKKLLKVAFQEQRPGWIRVLYAAGACAHDALLLAIVGRQRGTAEMLYKEYNVDVGGIPTADELRNDDGTDPDLPPYQLAHNNDMPEVAEDIAYLAVQQRAAEALREIVDLFKTLPESKEPGATEKLTAALSSAVEKVVAQ